MTRDWGRGIGALVVLAGLWVLVYWWWEPSGGRISFDAEPKSLGGAEQPLAVSTAPTAPAPAAPPTASPIPRQSPKPPAPQRPAPEQPRLAVVPPSFRPYTVKTGDTWESIAARELGSATLSDSLRRANPMVTDELKAGREIRIPTDPGNIQGRPIAEAPAAPQQTPVVEYTVKGGDTLGGIARAYYGSTSYDDFIYQANRDRLADKGKLKIGDKLRLPPKPN